MPLNCGVGEDSWESCELQDQTSQSWRKSVLNIHWKDWCWSWSSSTLDTWCEDLTLGKTWIGKDLDSGKDWKQEEKQTAEDEMIGLRYWLNGHEFEQAPGDSERQWSLACCSQWDHKELDLTEWLNNNTVKGLRVINEAVVPVFLELSCFFYDPVDVGNLTSGSSAFSKSSLNIWNFLVHVLMRPSLKDFEHYLASLWNECNCAVVWALFGTAFLWDWNENWAFPVLWPLLSFPNLLAYWVQHLNNIIF